MGTPSMKSLPFAAASWAASLSLVSDLVEKGELEFQPAWVDKDRQAIIEAACARSRYRTPQTAQGCAAAGVYL